MKRLALRVVALFSLAVLTSCNGYTPVESAIKPKPDTGFLLKKSDPAVPFERTDFGILPTELKPVATQLMILNPVIKRAANNHPGDAIITTPVEFPVSLIFNSVTTDISNCQTYSQGEIVSQCRSLEYRAVSHFVAMLRDSRIKPSLKQAVIDDLTSDRYLNLFNAPRLAYEVAARCRHKHQQGYVRLYWHAVPCDGRGEKLSFMDARRKGLIK